MLYSVLRFASAAIIVAGSRKPGDWGGLILVGKGIINHRSGGHWFCRPRELRSAI